MNEISSIHLCIRLVTNTIDVFLVFRREKLSTKQNDLMTEDILQVNQYSTVMTHSMPKANTTKIFTQSLPMSPIANQSSSHSWLHRFSNRFNSSLSATDAKTNSFMSTVSDVPSKSLEAKLQYQKMSNEAKRIQQQYEKQLRQKSFSSKQREEFLSKSLILWTEEILPYWSKYGDIPRSYDSDISKLWWHGLPPRKCNNKIDRSSISSI
jgi:ATP-dependent Lon protease